MTTAAAPLFCPVCGTAMNHQADKLVEPRTPAEARAADPVWGGFLESVYACPNCGRIESRRASWS